MQTMVNEIFVSSTFGCNLFTWLNWYVPKFHWKWINSFFIRRNKNERNICMFHFHVRIKWDREMLTHFKWQLRNINLIEFELSETILVYFLIILQMTDTMLLIEEMKFCKCRILIRVENSNTKVSDSQTSISFISSHIFFWIILFLLRCVQDMSRKTTKKIKKSSEYVE